MRIAALQDRDDLTLVQGDESVASVKEALGITAPDVDGLFLRAEEGEIVEAYGFAGVVPLLTSPLVRLV